VDGGVGANRLLECNGRAGVAGAAAGIGTGALGQLERDIGVVLGGTGIDFGADGVIDDAFDAGATLASDSRIN